MLHLDITGTLAKSLTPSLGIPDQEFAALRATARRYCEEWLKERENGAHGWAMDPYRKRTIDRVEEICAGLPRGIDTVVWLGIGGSGLGPRVIQDVFETPETSEMILLDTLDPAHLAQMLPTIDWRRTLLVVASKSGETIETMSVFFLLWEKLRNTLKEKAAAHVVAITDPEKSPLRDFALEKRFAMLPISDGTGGRYSIFTPVGLLPLALFGADVSAFIRGAKEMDTLCQNVALEENPALLLAATQFILERKRGYLLRVVMPYSHRLRSFGLWEQQLIAESLGKKELGNPIPVAAVGTADQHSLLQQWMAGPRKFWHLFITEEERARIAVPEDVPTPFRAFAGKTFGQLLDACAEGTARGLTAAKRPHAQIGLARLDEFHLGQLFFLSLAEVVFLGKFYRIDPYGQPGVEIGKRITRDILTRGKGAG